MPVKPKLNQIFVLVASMEYEPPTLVVGAFFKKEAAETLRQRILDHDRMRPRYSGEYEEDRYDAFEAAEKAWIARRPGKLGSTEWDDYTITPTTLT